jgi:hypothetical protein
MSRRLCILLLLAPALWAGSASAHAVPAQESAARPATTAASAKPPKPSKPGKPSKPSRAQRARNLLWATVNVCDTADAPDTIGIRGSMPGSGTAAEQMYMRFGVLYLDPADRRWKQIGASGDSGWISVGSARYRSRQSGRNFVVRPPAQGSFRLRGEVTFEWRREGRVVRRAVRRTTGGHRGTRGADPANHSAATCRVRA